jgi:hypothetical protein
MNKAVTAVKELATPLHGAGAVAIASAIYLFYKQQTIYIGLGLGVGFLVYALSRRNLIASILAGCIAAILIAERRRTEGFNSSENAVQKALASVKQDDSTLAAFGKEEPSKKATPPPDNGSRGEFFELGKKYKLPSEEDDKGFHLDAGTTFMNAYKSLKPDQIAAMTKDTQELMDTQKQLMATLNTLKPLMQDGKSMMDTFQSYFGSSGAPTAT